MSADTVIRGGTVIDGTGSPGQVADVAVTDGRISDIGTGLTGRRALDATGQVARQNRARGDERTITLSRGCHRLGPQASASR